MERNGGLKWKRQDNGSVLVVYWEEVLPKDADALIQRLRGASCQESPAKPPLPPVVFRSNNRSFGKLPPGSHPRWQSREWIGFACWLVVVVALLIGAAWRNASYLF